jgi:16S rRNA (guanine1207-N2)-methyltransferase
MKADHRDTLLLAFEKRLADQPEPGQRWAFLNAAPLPGNAFRDALSCEQAFRPEFNELKSAGYDVSPALGSSVFHGAMVIMGRVRQVNHANIVRARNMVRDGGSVVLAGSKTTGILPVRKWLSEMGVEAEVLSKHHAQVLVFRHEGDDWHMPAEIEDAGAEDTGGWHVAPGMFSAEGPDAASRLLSEFFPGRLKGKVADFGAGWGYLSKRALELCPEIGSIDLYEADWNALEAAKRNLADANVPTDFHWCDVTRELRKQPFDRIIMNPPFHTGRAATPELGKHFIQAAASTLVPGGRLLLVANRQLPYERTLEGLFRKAAVLEEREGFKVIEAIKGG